MMNILKKIKVHYYLIVILFIAVFHNAFFNILSNINTSLKKKDDEVVIENNLLKRENTSLKEELESLSKLDIYAEYNYSLTRMSFREVYNDSVIYIMGGSDKGYKIGNALINEAGVVGIISEVYTDYSKVNLLFDINNFSVKINDSYGSIVSYKDGLLLVQNISNYDNIHLNDEVYTSSLGAIHESLYIGYVYKIDENNINKDIYIKSNVNFNNLNFMYVVGVE